MRKGQASSQGAIRTPDLRVVPPAMARRGHGPAASFLPAQARLLPADAAPGCPCSVAPPPAGLPLFPPFDHRLRLYNNNDYTLVAILIQE